ncbi:MAG: hypothetical protein CMJ77_05895 [Planctomycetaceae bacterium]|nr:hypothetical protein [Planctomycetaceae bacterium]
MLTRCDDERSDLMSIRPIKWRESCAIPQAYKSVGAFRLFRREKSSDHPQQVTFSKRILLLMNTLS